MRRLLAIIGWLLGTIGALGSMVLLAMMMFPEMFRSASALDALRPLPTFNVGAQIVFIFLVLGAIGAFCVFLSGKRPPPLPRNVAEQREIAP